VGLPKYNVTCVFEDGATARFQASPLETVYQAALRSGLGLETDCREGACGVCKAFCADGEGDIGDISDEALTEQEQEEGYMLCCQARPRSDLVLEFGYPLSLLKKTTRTIDGAVAEAEPVADEVVRLVIRADSEPPAFLPGQYVNITVPGSVSGRSYSFANSSAEPGRMEFFIRMLEDGAMSNYLRTKVRPGDPVKLEGPFGRFFLRPPRGNRLIMVAGGTGLAPMLSMLSQLEGMAPARPQVTLLYGANRPGELFGIDRVRAYDWVELKTITVKGGGDWDGPQGFVTDLISDDLLDEPSLADAYLCGPPPMIDAARSAFERLGVPARRVFAEKFLPSAP
jgi:anthranilate 1,2-dioxygenase reductase subunit